MPKSTDPTFYRSPGEAIAAPRAARLRRRLRPRRPAKDAIAVIDTDPSSPRLRPGGGLERAAHRRQRAAPLRLERLLQRPVPPGPRQRRCAAGAPLPDRPRHPLVADLCAGHQARPPQPPVVREITADRQGRLLPPPYRPLRARRHLHVNLGGANGNDGPGGVALLDHDSFDVIGAWDTTAGSSTSAMTAGGT